MKFRLVLLVMAFGVSAGAHTTFDTYKNSNSADLACRRIVEAYSSCHEGMVYDSKTKLVTIDHYSSRVPCSDGKNLPFFDRLEKSDFASQLAIAYRTGVVSLPNTNENDDAGRFRFDPMFKSIYGDSAQAVRRNLISVPFLNQRVPFNAKNGAASALASVGVDLQKEIQLNTELRNFLKPWLTKKIDLALMTFNWRKVAPTNRLSNHSFGAAIDLNHPTPDGPVYWLWDLARQRQKQIEQRTGRKVRLTDVLKTIRERDSADFKPTRIIKTPRKLIEIFERHGFIWGGKWFHFDSMHFEYRPEFFAQLHPNCLVPANAMDLSDDPALTDESPETDSTELMDLYHWD